MLIFSIKKNTCDKFEWKNLTEWMDTSKWTWVLSLSGNSYIDYANN